MARIRTYTDCIAPIMAQEALDQLPVVSFPHYKIGKARELEKKLRRATRVDFQTEAPSSTKDLYQHLVRTMGNG